MTNRPAGYAKTTLYIAVTQADGDVPLQQETDLDKAGFEALNWQQISKVVAVPDFGGTSSFASQAYVDQNIEESIETNIAQAAGQIMYREVIGNNGQNAMKAAGAIHNANFAFKHVLNDAPASDGTPTIRYVRGLVGRPVYPGGGTEDWQMVQQEFKQNQMPVIDEAAAGA